MTPEMGLAGFRIAIFLIVISAPLLALLKPNSAEFVIMTLTLGLGLAIAGVIALLVRRSLH